MKIGPLVPRILCLFQTSLVWLPRIIRSRREKKSIPITNGRTRKKNHPPLVPISCQPGMTLTRSLLFCGALLLPRRPTWHEIEFARRTRAASTLGHPLKEQTKESWAAARILTFFHSFFLGDRDRKQLSSLPIIACVRAKWGIPKEKTQNEGKVGSFIFYSIPLLRSRPLFSACTFCAPLFERENQSPPIDAKAAASSAAQKRCRMRTRFHPFCYDIALFTCNHRVFPNPPVQVC